MVKNFAQMVELSTGTDDLNTIKNVLYNLNVAPIILHTPVKIITEPETEVETETDDFTDELNLDDDENVKKINYEDEPIPIESSNDSVNEVVDAILNDSTDNNNGGDSL